MNSAVRSIFDTSSTRSPAKPVTFPPPPPPVPRKTDGFAKYSEHSVALPTSSRTLHLEPLARAPNEYTTIEASASYPRQ